MSRNGNFSLLVTLTRPLCPCTERLAARSTGTLAPGSATFAIRYTADGRYVLRVECTSCGAAIEEEFSSALRLTMAGPPPGPGALTFKATQPPGKA